MGSRLILTIFFGLGFLFSGKAQQLERLAKVEDITIVYHTQKGKIAGAYKSYYKDGTLRAEGQFKNNQRVGEWSVYDSKSSLIQSRIYSTPYAYQAKYPPIPNVGPIPLLMNNPVVPKMNKHGYMEYVHLDEMDIMWSKRVWREINRKDNAALFKNNLLANALIENIKSGVISEVYKDDNFEEAVGKSFILDSVNIIGFKFKEDWMFTDPQQIMEVRPIGICLVIEGGNSITKEEELCWIWFPDCRKALAKVKLNEKGETISLDQVFFERKFASIIYKEEDVYVKKPKLNAETIELSIIEQEHNFWMGKLEYIY